ncbi:unnamed protein product, partial [Polarella glacialis]
ATAGTGLLLVLPAASAPAIFRQGFDHIVGLLASATSYMSDALHRLWLRGARSVVLASGDGEFANAVCEGAAAVAGKLGLTVLGNFVFDSWDIATK